VADRFYAPVSFDTATIELSRDESQHLAGVLRKSPGDVVEIFDGHGNSAEAVVATADKRAACLRIVRRLPSTLAVSQFIELATAVPKGDRASWLIEKATELGADAWTPLLLTRSVVDPGEGKLAKLRQTVIAACKQCGRNRLLEINSTQTWSDWLGAAARQRTLVVAHPSGASAAAVLPKLASPARTATSIALVIGPEGGFTDVEIAAAVEAGAHIVNLGPHILRLETAALAALAWLRLASSR
jgi:16S rRNA (uracil1498-N3)-methyltransferase